MRKGSFVRSEHEYEAGQVMCYHANHTGSVSKHPDNMHSFIWAFTQYYLGRRCSHVSYIRQCLAYLLLNMLLFSKIRAFCAGFQSGHYHILWTGPYQVKVPALTI